MAVAYLELELESYLELELKRPRYCQRGLFSSRLPARLTGSFNLSYCDFRSVSEALIASEDDTVAYYTEVRQQKRLGVGWERRRAVGWDWGGSWEAIGYGAPFPRLLPSCHVTPLSIPYSVPALASLPLPLLRPTPCPHGLQRPSTSSRNVALQLLSRVGAAAAAGAAAPFTGSAVPFGPPLRAAAARADAASVSGIVKQMRGLRCGPRADSYVAVVEASLRAGKVGSKGNRVDDVETCRAPGREVGPRKE